MTKISKTIHRLLNMYKYLPFQKKSVIVLDFEKSVQLQSVFPHSFVVPCTN
jgi:hypothetical protein